MRRVNPLKASLSRHRLLSDLSYETHDAFGFNTGQQRPHGTLFPEMRMLLQITKAVDNHIFGEDSVSSCQEKKCTG